MKSNSAPMKIQSISLEQNSSHLVIMAGGIGSRFWPMSTSENPKQFIDVLGIGKSLLQLTVERFLGVIPEKNIWIVTSSKYKEIIVKQLGSIVDSEQILLEPCMRNTAPCIAYVTWKIRHKNPDANIVFSPADHIIWDKNLFQNIIVNGLDFVRDSDSILTLGITPNKPETGYGYIKGGEFVAGKFDRDIKKVEKFTEKPCLEVAKGYLMSGDYFWNSGIFIWNVNTILSEFELFLPDLFSRFNNIAEFFYTDREQDVIDHEFPFCQSISIDFAIMEKSEKVFVYPADIGWSDLGTWGSLYNYLDKDVDKNALAGNDVKVVDCSKCMIHVSSPGKVIIQGLDDFIVVEQDGQLLICKMESEQLIKKWLE